MGRHGDTLFTVGQRHPSDRPFNIRYQCCKRILQLYGVPDDGGPEEGGRLGGVTPSAPGPARECSQTRLETRYTRHEIIEMWPRDTDATEPSVRLRV